MTKEISAMSVFFKDIRLELAGYDFCRAVPNTRPCGEDTVRVKVTYADGTEKELYVLNGQLMDIFRAGINAVKFKNEFYKEEEKI